MTAEERAQLEADMQAHFDRLMKTPHGRAAWQRVQAKLTAQHQPHSA